jgi:hypothetical protein
LTKPFDPNWSPGIGDPRADGATVWAYRAEAVLEEKLYGIDEEPDSNPIPVHVHHLRRQLEAAGATVAIHTSRGVGYILADTTTP